MSCILIGSWFISANASSNLRFIVVYVKSSNIRPSCSFACILRAFIIEAGSIISLVPASVLVLVRRFLVYVASIVIVFSLMFFAFNARASPLLSPP
ncbi:MAG: hypothetical protein V8Q90_04815 [Bacilli bacterium]